jgi:UbiD family decarboxylase
VEPVKHPKSLREFIDDLAAVGEVQQIDTEVDWNLELGAVARRTYELRAPAPLFTTITGIEKGFRVLSAPGGLSARPGLTYARIALALGLPAGTGGPDIVIALADARLREPLAPRVVDASAAPCKENIMIGDEVDLLKFPMPVIHDGDGGRRVQSFGMNIAKTPDGSWTSWSVDRMMLIDRNRLACLIPSARHLGIIRALWGKRGEDLPIAVALGVEPALPYVGGMPLPEGDDEAYFLGGYFGEPLELVPAETVDLLVPATAEIVIEGHVSLTDVVREGPRGEGRQWPMPVLHVTAVTHRNGAILPVAVAGAPVGEDHTCWGLPHAAEMTHVLREDRLPVSVCWSVLESAALWWVVALRPDWHELSGLTSQEMARRVGEVVFGAGDLAFGVPKLILVEHDFDVVDPPQLIWAFASRAHPRHGEEHFADGPLNIIPIHLEEHERLSHHATKVVHNCLLAGRFPADERPTTADFAHNWPAGLQQHVVDNWNAYGFR